MSTAMRNRSLDLNYKSFTRNRLTMFEYRKKPLLDQLERIENDMERLIPQNDSEKLRRPGWVRSAERDVSQLLSKLSQFDQRRYADLQERMKETEERLDAVEIEEEDIELEAIADEIKHFEEFQKEYMEEVEKAKKKFEEEWDLTDIELKYSENDYIYKVMSKLEELRGRQTEINKGKALRELRKKKEVEGVLKFDNEEDKGTYVRRVAQRPVSSVEPPTKPETEEPPTIMRRRGGGSIKRDEG